MTDFMPYIPETCEHCLIQFDYDPLMAMFEYGHADPQQRWDPRFKVPEEHRLKLTKEAWREQPEKCRAEIREFFERHHRDPFRADYDEDEERRRLKPV